MTTLMIQGCTSDAGKSTMVAAICRLLAKTGQPVAPFKPQNMALNSAVTEDGGEIGRAQAVQAFAAGIAPHTDHNPVLLKPTSDCVAQVIIQGHAIGNLNALDYHAYKQTTRQAVIDSWGRLASQYKWVIVEGAGSPAEVNLREGDIANMGFAEKVDCPVWLVADIDRGGVFAHIVGTLACLSETEQARIQGFIINRFRGDLALLEPGIDWLEEKTGKPVLAVVPYLHGLDIAAEDAIASPVSGQGNFRIVVLTLPHISNHTDFDPLRAEPNVTVIFSSPGHPLPPADLLILPGTKNTCMDLRWLREQGYEDAIRKHLRYGGKVIGICGGYQILGEWIADPHGIEGESCQVPGLGWLPCRTTLQSEKLLKNVHATLHLNGETAAIKGYEIHHGATEIPETSRTIVHHPSGKRDGLQSDDQQVLGCYLHGLFDLPEARALVLRWAGCQSTAVNDAESSLQVAIDRLAHAVDQAFLLRQQQSLADYLSLEN